MPKHANDWVPESPTPAQLKEFFAQIECGRINKFRLQEFLRAKEELSVLGHFKYDKTKDGWTLLEDVPFDGKEFTPEFVEFLGSGEFCVKGEEMRQRAIKLNANFGQHHAEWLLENPNRIPRELRGRCLVFPGTEWQDSDGGRHVPDLFWLGDEWCLRWYWLEGDWDDNDRLVRPRG